MLSLMNIDSLWFRNKETYVTLTDFSEDQTSRGKQKVAYQTNLCKCMIEHCLGSVQEQ